MHTAIQKNLLTFGSDGPPISDTEPPVPGKLTGSVLVYSGTPSVLTDVTVLISGREVTQPDCDVAIGDDRTRSLYDSHGLDRPKDGY